MPDPYGAFSAPAAQAPQADPYGAFSAPATPHTAAPQPKPQQPWMDWIKSGASGVLNGVAGMADYTDPAALMMRAGQFGASLVNPKAAAAMAPYVPQSNVQRAAPLGGNYQPKTVIGRYTKTIGEFAPNAAMGGEGIIPRVASTVIPALASQGARDATQAMGGGPFAQTVAGFAGGMAGGKLTGDFSGAGADLPVQNIAPTEQPVANAIQAAMDVTGSTVPDVKAALAQGKLPVAASPGLSQLGEGVTTLPGAGQVAIRDAIGARMGTQSDRALGAVHSILGVDPAAAQGDMDTIVASGRAKAAPIYDQISADQSPVWSPTLASLAQRPAIKKAIGVASNDMLNAGEHPTAAGFQLDPDTGSWVLPSSGSLEGLTEQQPTAATWVKVHQALGRTVERSPVTGRPLPDSESAGNYGISTAGNALKGALAGDPESSAVGAIPGYDKALAVSGDYLSQSSAFNRAGGQVLSGATPVSAFGKFWGSLTTPAQQDAARASIANDILEASDKGKIVPGQFRSPGVQQKLAIAFGHDAADQFTSQMEEDLGERQAYSKIIGGPQTASRLALIAQYQKQSAPSGMAGMAGKALGAAEWAQSLMHPTLLATKIAHAAVNAGGKGAKDASLPWEDPETNAQLGQVLSDPGQMGAFLDKMQAQNASVAQAKAFRRSTLLNAPRLAVPALIGGAGPSPSGAGGGPGSPRQ